MKCWKGCEVGFESAPGPVTKAVDSARDDWKAWKTFNTDITRYVESHISAVPSVALDPDPSDGTLVWIGEPPSFCAKCSPRICSCGYVEGKAWKAVYPSAVPRGNLECTGSMVPCYQGVPLASYAVLFAWMEKHEVNLEAPGNHGGWHAYHHGQRNGGSYISTNGETAVKALLAMAAKLGVEL